MRAPTVESRAAWLEALQVRSTSQLLHRNVKRFRGGLVSKAHRLLYRSTLGLRVIKKKEKYRIPWKPNHFQSTLTFTSKMIETPRVEKGWSVGQPRGSAWARECPTASCRVCPTASCPTPRVDHGRAPAVDSLSTPWLAALQVHATPFVRVFQKSILQDFSGNLCQKLINGSKN